MSPRSEPDRPYPGTTMVGDAVGYSLAERRRGPSIEDGRLGSMAYFAGWMSPEQVAACLQLLRGAIKRWRASDGEGAQGPPRFGELAAQAGYLSPEQVEALLRIQSIHRPTNYDRTFGALAVRDGLVSQEQLDECLHEQEELLRTRHEAPCLGLLMVERKLLTGEQVKEILQRQEAEGTGPFADKGSQLPERPTGRRPPAPPSRRILCRCGACGEARFVERWGNGTRCPECGSREFAPVPVTQGAMGYAMADRRRGPALEDNRLGRMAFYAGWMTEQQVQKCLQIQQADIERRRFHRFGEVAVEQRFLTQRQVDALLRVQAIHRSESGETTFGAIAVRAGFLNQEDVDQCLAEQERLLTEHQEAPLLGMMLEEKGFLTRKHVKAILQFQARYRQGALAALAPDAVEGPGLAEKMRDVLTARRTVVTAASLALLALSIAAMATGWFGYTGWRPEKALAGCSKCAAVLKVDPSEASFCSSCGSHHTLAPLARCTKCGKVFLYGSHGSGTRCPECGSTSLGPVKDFKMAHRWAEDSERSSARAP